MEKIKILAICGKAGSGKDTILKEIVSSFPNQFNVIKPYTTRPMRAGEKQGEPYNFITEKEFIKKIENEEILEATIFNDWYYGTGFDSYEKNKINIGVFNPSGIDSLMDYKEKIDITIIKLNTSDKIRLIRQLNREENPDVEEIIRRFNADAVDFSFFESNYNDILLHMRNENIEDIDKIIDYIRDNFM